MVNRIALLGATGSIGRQTLDALRTCLPDIRVNALTAHSHVEELALLINEFSPRMACVSDADSAKKLHALLRVPCEILTGMEGLCACAADSGADTVVNALVGRAGLVPTLAAIEAGRHVALANKETLVTAGSLVTRRAKAKNVRLTPIDSEHSAIWQCLQGNNSNKVERLILTASGGPFREWPAEKIKTATAADALRHPTWLMGPKITVDCATLMNKGLEVIEAMWLFDMDIDRIEVVVHPQSVVHSMVLYADGAVMAQMGTPDMRLPILYALTAPERVETPYPRLDLTRYDALTFAPPDTENFPCLSLALHAARTCGTLPAVMNTLNEHAVGLFLQDKLDFYGIPRLIADAFDTYTVKHIDRLEDIFDAERWAEEFLCSYPF